MSFSFDIKNSINIGNHFNAKNAPFLFLIIVFLFGGIINVAVPEKEDVDVLSSEDRLYRVVRVIDGDTIVLEDDSRVRYIGVDTPESKKPNTPVECFSLESAKRNKDLVLGKKVRLEKDVNNTDRYGRLLRYVWVGDIMVNEQLVREGYAQAVSFPPDVKYQDLLQEAEREAIYLEVGFWGSECN